MNGNDTLTPEQRGALLAALRARFEANMSRHKGIVWQTVYKRLSARPAKLWSLNEMERTGGEPDVVRHDPKIGAYIFYDCSEETPAGRRSLCYDREAQDARPAHPPKYNAIGMAGAMGVSMLTEEEYRGLQRLGAFDGKTSSWVRTPSAVRQLGGALFCDRRYGQVFTYHNSAGSYYAARGFRCCITV